MKNKVLARIAASAISVAMLGTAVFAADPAISKDETSATLSFLVGTDNADISINADENQITMMAYMVDATINEVETTVENMPEYGAAGAGEMIALDQVGGAAGFGEVPVDVTKLAEGKKIAVKLGCTSGTVSKFLIALSADQKTIEIIVGDVNGDGKANANDAALIKVYASKLTAAQKNNFNTANGSNVGATVTAPDGTTYIIGDVNGDGKANANDAALIKVYASKLTATQKNNFNTANGSNVGATVTVVED